MPHIVNVAARPKRALTGSWRPRILKFPPSLKGRSASGLLILRLMMEAWANMKASREPKAYKAPMFRNTSLAKKPGSIIRMAIIPKRIMEI